MIFIIGGSYQGKCTFACETFHLAKDDFFFCTEDTIVPDLSKRAIAHIEQFALGCIQRGEEPRAWFEAHLSEIQDKVFLSDDISCGVVPIDETLRAWREATGRMNNYIARQSTHVWRVFCGLGQVLK